jgi:hypothetical protein
VVGQLLSMFNWSGSSVWSGPQFCLRFILVWLKEGCMSNCSILGCLGLLLLVLALFRVKVGGEIKGFLSLQLELRLELVLWIRLTNTTIMAKLLHSATISAHVSTYYQKGSLYTDNTSGREQYNVMLIKTIPGRHSRPSKPSRRVE